MKSSSPMNRVERLVSTFCWVYTALLIAQWIIFYTYVLRARWVLGRWPSWNNPDPKVLGFEVHHWLVTAGGLTVLMLFPYLLLTLLMGTLLDKVRWKPACVAVTAFIAFAISAWVDDRFGSWFVD